MTRVLVVEDHTLVRQSLVKTVAAEDGFEVAGEASRGDEAVQAIGRSLPDVLLLDITIPGGSGIDVAARVKAAFPSVRVMFLTMHDDDASISRAIGLGADGYVLKTASTEELIRALRTVAEGNSYLSPAIARRVIDLAHSRGSATALTERELEILHLLAGGARPVEVGERLFVSLKTVKNHLTNIYSKLGVQTGAQAVAEAYRRGLVAAETV